MSSPPSAAPRPDRGVVVVVVGQAQGVARLVHDHDLVVGARPVSRLPLPGVLGGVEPLAVELEILVAERGLVAPPEVAPAVVRPGPDDDEIVDGPVAVVVVAREVVALGVKMGQGFLDQRLARGRGHGHRSPRIGGPVPAQDGAADLEHVVGSPAVVIAEAFVGVARVAVPEQLGGDRRDIVDGGVIRKVDEQGEDLDAALGRQAAPPAAGQGQAFGRFAGATAGTSAGGSAGPGRAGDRPDGCPEPGRWPAVGRRCRRACRARSRPRWAARGPGRAAPGRDKRGKRGFGRSFGRA